MQGPATKHQVMQARAAHHAYRSSKSSSLSSMSRSKSSPTSRSLGGWAADGVGGAGGASCPPGGDGAARDALGPAPEFEFDAKTGLRGARREVVDEDEDGAGAGRGGGRMFARRRMRLTKPSTSPGKFEPAGRAGETGPSVVPTRPRQTGHVDAPRSHCWKTQLSEQMSQKNKRGG
jgi:hypothetical protein